MIPQCGDAIAVQVRRSGEMKSDPPESGTPAPHRRRVRYSGKNPRGFADKYKERDPAKFPEVFEKVLAAGKTPAGTHRPIMVEEMLEALAPKPGEIAVDCTLGHGGHAERLLQRISPGGHLLGLDADPIELPKTEERLRSLGHDASIFTAHRTNFASLARVLAGAQLGGADLILADLGVSSMQLDNPARGFSLKASGPLDMRLNPNRGPSAAEWLESAKAESLARVLTENADEIRSEELAALLAGQRFETTAQLAATIRAALLRLDDEERELSVRRVFQAIRVEVNDEFGALETFLRNLPNCLAPDGRVAILTFHSGEDRRVKKAFAECHRAGIFCAIAPEVIRASPEERRANPRSTPAKLRWARRSPN